MAMGSESGQITKVFTDMNQKTLFESLLIGKQKFHGITFLQGVFDITLVLVMY